jgi:hypothetical protein
MIDTGSESQLWSGVYYQEAGALDYFRAVDHITSEIIADLCKIKNLKCDGGPVIHLFSRILNHQNTDGTEERYLM